MTKQKVSLADPDVHVPVSVDRRGVRFELDGRIFRAFRPDTAPFYRSLLASPSAAALFEAGLVRSWISDLMVEGFDLVVESEPVPVVTYPTEWPTAVLREAGFVIARVGRALSTIGLGLQDAHPWNVLFDGTRGVWIDLGSVIEATHVTRYWHREFRAHVAVPLALHARGWHTMADAVAAEHRVVRAKALWDGTWPRRLFPPRFVRLSRFRHDPGRYFDALVDYLEGLPVQATPTEWSRYLQAPNAVVGATGEYDDKQRAVDTFLRSMPTGTVLDVGANAGWFSELAAHHGHRVAALDTDDVTLSALFAQAHARSLPILPLRMDIMWPTAAHGLSLAYAPATTRLRADVTMWLAVLHHLARQGYSFEMVAKTIATFTEAAAIVEFIPSEDPHIRDWPVAREDWYRQDAFVRAMAPEFPSVEILPSSPAPRTMLLFRRQ